MQTVILRLQSPGRVEEVVEVRPVEQPVDMVGEPDLAGEMERQGQRPRALELIG